MGGTNAQEALNIPSILILVGGGLGVLLGLLGMVGGAGAGMSQAFANNPELAKYGPLMQSAGGAGAIIGGLLRIGMSGVAIFGALKMRSLQGYGLAMAAAIISIIPCTGCCCVNMPVGIWALVILMKPEVKAAFTG